MSTPKFKTRAGLFGLCAGVWDEGTQSFHKATDTQISACCLTSCKPEIEVCLRQCLDEYGPRGNNPDEGLYMDCRNNCSRIVLSCRNTCRLMNPNWGPHSAMMQCAEKAGCGKYPNLEKDCLKKHEETIKICCEHNCTPTSTLNCRDHCNVRFLNYMGESENPLVKMYDDNPEFHGNPFDHIDTKPSTPGWYIFALITVIISAVFIVMVLKR